MKLTEYIYYIYSYLNIYRNNKIISNSDQYGEKWDIFLIIFFLSKINIIYIFTTLFKLYNISCNLVFTNLQKKKMIEQTNNFKFIKQ